MTLTDMLGALYVWGSDILDKPTPGILPPKNPIILLHNAVPADTPPGQGAMNMMLARWDPNTVNWIVLEKERPGKIEQALESLGVKILGMGHDTGLRDCVLVVTRAYYNALTWTASLEVSDELLGQFIAGAQDKKRELEEKRAIEILKILPCVRRQFDAAKNHRSRGGPDRALDTLRWEHLRTAAHEHYSRLPVGAVMSMPVPDELLRQFIITAMEKQDRSDAAGRKFIEQSEELSKRIVERIKSIVDSNAGISPTLLPNFVLQMIDQYWKGLPDSDTDSLTVSDEQLDGFIQQAIADEAGRREKRGTGEQPAERIWTPEVEQKQRSLWQPVLKSAYPGLNDTEQDTLMTALMSAISKPGFRANTQRPEAPAIVQMAMAAVSEVLELERKNLRLLCLRGPYLYLPSILRKEVDEKIRALDFLHAHPLELYRQKQLV